MRMYGNEIFAAAEALEREEARANRAGQWFCAALLGSERAAAFCERTKGLSLVRAGSEGSNQTGAVLVPTEIENAIIAQRATAGVFRQEADARTMGSDTRILPRRTAGFSVGFTMEGNPIAETNGAFDGIGLTARKAGGITRFSSEFYDDEAADFGRYMVEEFGNALAYLEDDCGFNGDGTSEFGGTLGITKALVDGKHDASKVAAASGHDTFAEIDAADLGSLMAKLPEQYWPNAKWYASSYAIGTTFARLGMTSGGTIQTAFGQRAQFYYGGFPIVPTGLLPGAGSQSGAAMLLFGDLRQASTLGSRRGMSLALSRHYKFAEDQLAAKATERFDIANHSLGDNSSAGALIGLVGA
jgi:HK97 family phage major capsid protein